MAQWVKTFRSRFRLTYESFLALLNMVVGSRSGLFKRWVINSRPTMTGATSKRTSSPIELLLLGSLRYLGRGWTFCDLAESTYIHREVHRVFFHRFIKFGARELYPMYVKMPSSIEELRECEMAYRIAGFPGCIGSTDATHIILERVAYIDRQDHLGFKSKQTTRTYNMTVNHKRQILHCTTGHPGRWNDKTLIRFDDFVDELRNGTTTDKMTFELASSNGHSYQMKGAYVIVDNGYLNWSTTVPPMKHSMFRAEMRFSEWLESLRKDVECTFGILKGRWRILKTGVRLHNTAAADDVWLTCCALHNMLLEVDGLSKGWRSGVPSYWEKAGGHFQDEDVPASIQRLLNPLGTNSVGVQMHDISKFGYRPGENKDMDRTNEIEDENSAYNNKEIEQQDNLIIQGAGQTGKRIAVTSLSLKAFRYMLIDYFNILFRQDKVVWPTRLER